MKKFLALLAAVLVAAFTTLPAFAAEIVAPQRQFNCVCGRSFTNEQKWSQHKQKCYVEVETTAEETTSEIETTVKTTESTVALTTTVPATTEAKPETTTAATTSTTVATTKPVTKENTTRIPVATTPAPVKIPVETTAEEITTEATTSEVTTTEMTTTTTTAPTTEKTTVAPTSTTSPSYSMIDVSFPEIKLSRINVEETVSSVQEDVPEETNTEITSETYRLYHSEAEKGAIPDTGSSKITVAAIAMAIIAGGMIFAVKKKSSEKA